MIGFSRQEKKRRRRRKGKKGQVVEGIDTSRRLTKLTVMDSQGEVSDSKGREEEKKRNNKVKVRRHKIFDGFLVMTQARLSNHRGRRDGKAAEYHGSIKSYSTHYAALLGRKTCVQVTMDAGFDLSTRVYLGLTPLEVCSREYY